jgi:hypothetical protein
MCNCWIGVPKMRLFGCAEVGDPPYACYACKTCAQRMRADPKICAALDDPAGYMGAGSVRAQEEE